MFGEKTVSEGVESRRKLLVMELRGLRKARGATMMKLVASPILMDALGPSEPLAALREQVEALGSDEQPRALQVAYGYARTERTLTQRRHGYAVGLGVHADTIEKWENAMIDEMAERLIRDGEAEVVVADYIQEAFGCVLTAFTTWAEIPLPDDDHTALERTYQEAQAELNRRQDELAELAEGTPVEAIAAHEAALALQQAHEALQRSLAYEQGYIAAQKQFSDLLIGGLEDLRESSQLSQ